MYTPVAALSPPLPGPGWLKNDLNKELKKFGFFFGPDPASNPSVGGMASTGSSGMSTLKVRQLPERAPEHALSAQGVPRRATVSGAVIDWLRLVGCSTLTGWLDAVWDNEGEPRIAQGAANTVIYMSCIRKVQSIPLCIYILHRSRCDQYRPYIYSGRALAHYSHPN